MAVGEIFVGAPRTEEYRFLSPRDCRVSAPNGEYGEADLFLPTVHDRWMPIVIGFDRQLHGMSDPICPPGVKPGLNFDTIYLELAQRFQRPIFSLVFQAPVRRASTYSEFTADRTGLGDQYARFLRDAVIPKIRKRWHLDGPVIMYGFSVPALFVLRSLEFVEGGYAADPTKFNDKYRGRLYRAVAANDNLSGTHVVLDIGAQQKNFLNFAEPHESDPHLDEISAQLAARGAHIIGPTVYPDDAHDPVYWRPRLQRTLAELIERAA